MVVRLHNTTGMPITKNPVRPDPGASLLKRPYVMTLEQETDLVTQAREKMQHLLEVESQPEYFTSRVHYHGVQVSQKQDGPFCIAKGVTQVPSGMTLDDIQDQFDHGFSSLETIDRLFQRIDPMMTHMSTVVEELQHKDQLLDASRGEKIRVLYGNMYVAPLVSDRDFCIVQHTCRIHYQGHDVFCSSSFSIELPEAVPNLQKSVGRVRATIQLTGYVYKPSHDNNSDPQQRLTMSFLGQCNPHGYLPTSIVNLASISQAMNVGRVRDLYAQLHAVKQEFHTSTDIGPMDFYHLARRGGSCIHAVPLIKAPRDGPASFYVHIVAHSEHDSHVEIANLEDLDEWCTLSSGSNDDDDQAGHLVDGKTVTFGSGKILDVVLQVTLKQQPQEPATTPELDLKFTNTAWRKSHLVVPASMSISKSHPSPQAAAANATQ